MAWLALDTSTDIASFAIKVNNKVYTQELTGMTTHAEKSLPAIDALFNEAGIHLSDISGVIFHKLALKFLRDLMQLSD